MFKVIASNAAPEQMVMLISGELTIVREYDKNGNFIREYIKNPENAVVIKNVGSKEE